MPRQRPKKRTTSSRPRSPSSPWLSAWPTAGLLILAATAPILAETHAQRRLGQHLYDAPSPSWATVLLGQTSVDIDVTGLHVGTIFRQVGTLHISADALDFGINHGGIQVLVHKLRVKPTGGFSADRSQAPAAESSPAVGHGPDNNPSMRTRVESILQRIRGIPIELRVLDDTQIELPQLRSLALTFRNSAIRLPGDGRILINFEASASDAEATPLRSLFEIQMGDDSLDRAKISGTGHLHRLGRWTVDGEIEPARARLRLRGSDGEQASFDIGARRGSDLRDPNKFHLEFVDFPAGTASWIDLDTSLPAQTSLSFEGARVNGSADLLRGPESVQFTLQNLRVAGLTIESPYLAREPLELGELVMNGELALATAEQEISGDIQVSHDSAQISVRGSANGREILIAAQLAPIQCQALLESAPRGLLPALAGMELEGEIDGSLDLHFNFDAVRSHAEREKELGEELPSPGNLNLQFPVLERCRIARDASGIDARSLAGPYRHRFISAEGSQIERVLAQGARGFVALAGVPNFAKAFVILEDARFWRHDGFDRAQMERAFWHNVGRAGFSRGASTISQQTARNLWLGGNRSVGRKLQEALLASRLESELSKQRILELYVNVIELGPNIHGIADAAVYHFGKRAQDLSLLEALHIASLAPAPVRYSRRWSSGNVDDSWMTDLYYQVRRLRVHGWINRATARQALDEQLVLRAHPPASG